MVSSPSRDHFCAGACTQKLGKSVLDVSEKESLFNVKTIAAVVGAAIGAGKGRIGAAAGALLAAVVADYLFKEGSAANPEKSDNVFYPTRDSQDPQVEKEAYKQCSQCGSLNKAGNFFCVYCGHRIEDE
jgi:hypothetical protein